MNLDVAVSKADEFRKKTKRGTIMRDTLKAYSDWR